MTVVFLSDVHLSEKEPAISEAFLRYLHALRTAPPQGVFILGDLFHAWLGDHVANAFARRMMGELKALGALCPVFFQHGNRDFLIGARFARESGVTLLPQRYCFILDGQRVLLEHGDLLCSDDLGYQRLRRIVRHRWFIRLARKTPYWVNARVGAFLRRQSGKHGARKAADWVDVSAGAVREVMDTWACDVLLHGHTHRPHEHVLADGRRRFVLGDWRPQGEVLLYDNGRWELTLPSVGFEASGHRE